MKVNIGPYPEGRDEQQVINVQIEEHDTWSMDLTLAHIIVPMLKQLKETKHGAPGSLPEFALTSTGSSQYCFDFYSEEDNAAWEAGHMHWDELMDKMIWSFEQVLINWEDQYWTVKPKIDLDAMLNQKDNDSEVNTHPLIWEEHGVCDWIGVDNHRKKMQEGFDLFGKYFCDLWD